MSDRGYQALAFELEAKAIEIEVKGMEAENLQRQHTGASLAYGVEHFDDAAVRLRELAEKIRALVFV